MRYAHGRSLGLGGYLSVLFLWLLLASYAQGAQPATLGIQNRNPGNISCVHWQAWKGAIGRDPWKHLRFATDLDGLKAMRKTLRAYYHKHHIDTVRGICERWVRNPRTDAEWLSRLSYEKAVADQAWLTIDEPLDLDDRRLMARVAKGIIFAENSQQPYPESLFKQAFNY